MMTALEAQERVSALVDLAIESRATARMEVRSQASYYTDEERQRYVREDSVALNRLFDAMNALMFDFAEAVAA